MKDEIWWLDEMWLRGKGKWEVVKWGNVPGVLGIFFFLLYEGWNYRWGDDFKTYIIFIIYIYAINIKLKICQGKGKGFFFNFCKVEKVGWFFNSIKVGSWMGNGWETGNVILFFCKGWLMVNFIFKVENSWKMEMCWNRGFPILVKEP